MVLTNNSADHSNLGFRCCTIPGYQPKTTELTLESAMVSWRNWVFLFETDFLKSFRAHLDSFKGFHSEGHILFNHVTKHSRFFFFG